MVRPEVDRTFVTFLTLVEKFGGEKFGRKFDGEKFGRKFGDEKTGGR